LAKKNILGKVNGMLYICISEVSYDLSSLVKIFPLWCFHGFFFLLSSFVRPPFTPFIIIIYPSIIVISILKKIQKICLDDIEELSANDLDTLSAEPIAKLEV
jgi:hypothetical protein